MTGHGEKLKTQRLHRHSDRKVLVERTGTDVRALTRQSSSGQLTGMLEGGRTSNQILLGQSNGTPLRHRP